MRWRETGKLTLLLPPERVRARKFPPGRLLALVCVAYTVVDGLVHLVTFIAK